MVAGGPTAAAITISNSARVWAFFAAQRITKLNRVVTDNGAN